MAEVGKRYVSPGGAEIIVTKGGPGTLRDGGEPLVRADARDVKPAVTPRTEAPQVQLGKRYKSADGAVELLVIKAGFCDLRYDGEPMELLQPKVLPSAD
jgi:hypothetical protein